jgi:chemotaxis protein methyltransferase CheR
VTWSSAAYEAVARVLGRHTGLHFPPARQPSAELGIRRAMSRARLTTPDDYPRLLEAGGPALDDLVAELTVGETYFFREPGQFAFLGRQVLPALRSRSVRAWSAGCASGEEAYSLAILFEENDLGERASTVGTDICHTALARAVRAVYTPWSLRGDWADRARPYLERKGAGLVLRESIKRRVTFAHLNLALDVYPSLATGTWGMDLVLCRNVLIYFDSDTVSAVARRLFAALAPGGWLLTAASDPPLGRLAPFASHVSDEGVFYRRSEGPVYSFTPRQSSEDDKVTRWQGDKVKEKEGAAPVTPSPPHLVTLSSSAPLDEAAAAFARGDYAAAVELAALSGEADAAALRVRALANLDALRAERAAAEAAARHPLRAELHYLHGALLLGLGRNDEAILAVRRALYLDRSLAAAHCTLGALLERRGDEAGARRAYRNARDLCAARPPEEEVPLTDGEHAGRLAEAADARLALLAVAP